VHDICARAELSVGSFYYHFEDKAGITLAILERESETFMQRLEAMDLRQADKSESTLNEVLHGPMAPLYRALREAAEIEPRVATEAVDARRLTQDRLAAAITRARREGVQYDIDARTIAWTLVALTRAALGSPLASEEPLARGIADVIQVLVRTGEVAADTGPG
jgi:AcrR family transcriptional regulator